MIQTSTDHGPSPLLSYTFFVRKFERCYDSKIFIPAVQQSHDGVACSFFRFAMVRCSRFRRNANALSGNLDQVRSALQMSGFTLGIYKPVIVRCPPLPSPLLQSTTSHSSIPASLDYLTFESQTSWVFLPSSASSATLPL